VSALVLIGPPGAGKTTIGQTLALKLGLGFLDTDQMVEARAGRSIGDIFLHDAEPAFRTMERAAVAEALECGAHEGIVIALGGGAPMEEANAAALRTAGAVVVFLDISPALAARRVGLNAARPLLRESPRKVWRELMAARRPTYEALSTAIIQVDGLSAADAADQIARLVMAKET
jgi:shikimate kinase